MRTRRKPFAIPSQPLMGNWKVVSPRDFLSIMQETPGEVAETRFVPPHRKRGKRQKAVVLVRYRF